MKAMAIYEDEYCIVFAMYGNTVEYFNKRNGSVKRQIINTHNVLIIPGTVHELGQQEQKYITILPRPEFLTEFVIENIFKARDYNFIP